MNYNDIDESNWNVFFLLVGESEILRRSRCNIECFKKVKDGICSYSSWSQEQCLHKTIIIRNFKSILC